MCPQKVQMGILGAAQIATAGVIKPARFQRDVDIIAIAARDKAKAQAFAKKHQVPRVYPTYDALLNDRDINAIYNPLPNSLHYEWTMNALEAGKHVLCEKPMASNADQAAKMVALAEQKGLVLAEAFHNLYHPLVEQMMGIVTSGTLGKIRRIEAHFCMPMFKRDDIRYHYDLAGGATMDLGCYTVRIIRSLSNAAQKQSADIASPPKVISANATCMSPQVDQFMTADIVFPHGDSQPTEANDNMIMGHMTCAMRYRRFPRINTWVIGEQGVLKAFNPFVPHVFNRLTLVKHGNSPVADRTQAHGRKVGRWVRGKSSYFYQLQEFVKAVQGQPNKLLSAEESIENMRIIDDIYRESGLKRRGT